MSVERICGWLSEILDYCCTPQGMYPEGMVKLCAVVLLFGGNSKFEHCNVCLATLAILVTLVP